MANNQNKGNVPPKLPQPRQNYQLWVILTLVIIISSIFYFNNSNGLIDISERRFEQMALSHDVENLTFIRGQNMVEVTLKKQALENAKYKSELDGRGPWVSSEGPHYRFKVLSADKFDEIVTDINKKLGDSDKLDYKIEERSDPTSMILNWGFLFLILLASGL